MTTRLIFKHIYRTRRFVPSPRSYVRSRTGERSYPPGARVTTSRYGGVIINAGALLIGRNRPNAQKLMKWPPVCNGAVITALLRLGLSESEAPSFKRG